MRYVLDSCVAVKWFLAEPDSSEAFQLLTRLINSVAPLDTFIRSLDSLP
jgi:hypothetical protein